MTGGIKHIEFWVSDLEKSLAFYSTLFPLIGWNRVEENGFSDGKTKMYFVHKDVVFKENTGPRHICFLAESRAVVDQVGEFVKSAGVTVIRGPTESRYLDRQSYTVDFKDPDGYILEVATPSEKL